MRLRFDVRLGTCVGAVLGSQGGCGSPVYGPRVPWAPPLDAKGRPAVPTVAARPAVANGAIGADRKPASA